MVLVLLLSLGGCTSESNTLKENLLGGFNDFLQSFSQHALTRNRDLQGKRVTGEDSYTGAYQAIYHSFWGKETLFGGTALKRKRGNKLQLTYTLEITSGSGTLYWREQEEMHVIANASSVGTYEFTLSSGDNYLVLEGDDLTGSLKITVE